MSDMTTEQFKTHLKKLDLNVTGAAPYLGLSPRQLQRIAAGSPVPGPLAKLLRIAVRYDLDLADLEKA